MNEPATLVDTSAAMARARELQAAHQPLEALDTLREAVARAPDIAAVRYNLGVLLTHIGRLEEAEGELRHVLARFPETPEVRHALSLALLGQGRFAEGWPLHDARGGIATAARGGITTKFPFPRWRGEPIAGKRVMLMPEQGLGDQIQFARYIPWLKAQGAEASALLLPTLVRLLAASFPDLTIIPASGEVDFADPDFWVTAYDLPALAGATIGTLPSAPYLRSPLNWDGAPEGFKVGLMTHGNPGFALDAYRSLGPDDAALLRSRLPGTIVELDPALNGVSDMAETAALIMGVDIVVSTDTAVGHLAGALGKRCLLLVPGFGADWRWMQGRSDSPWYPAHRLYRAAEDGGWDAAIDALTADARRLSEEAVTPPAPAPLPPEDPPSKGWFEALDKTRQAVAKHPLHPGAARSLGVVLVQVGELEEAEHHLRRAIALQGGSFPTAQYDLALTLLTQGRYREGWREHAIRGQVETLNIGYPKDVKFAPWQGEDLTAKRLTIMPEQGIGDQIQLARFIPQLVERGAEVTLITREQLVTIMSYTFPQIVVSPAVGRVSLRQPDYWTTVFDMMVPLDVTLDNIPPPPFLKTPRRWADPPPRFKIGLQTAGNSNHLNDRHRSLPPALAAAFRARLPGTIIDLDPERTGAADFADTAAAIAELDLVISVDTSVGHMAGALDRPCFLLLPGYSTDWRWMRGRDDTPWYPSHRLYRGGIDGSWSDALERVIADTWAFARERGHG